MGILILLIVIDLVVIGVVMYAVMVEKQEHHEHYVPDGAPQVAESAPIETRDWAVQTTSDTEAASPAVDEAPSATEETAATSDDSSGGSSDSSSSGGSDD